MLYYFQILLPIFISLPVKVESCINGPKCESDSTQFLKDKECPYCQVSPVQKFEGRNFPGGAVVKNPPAAVVENLPANAGDTGSSPGLGRSHMPRSN